MWLSLTGGMSVGKYDIVRSTIENTGGVIRLHGVAMKPGKPFLYATSGEAHVFGLPGNPLSSFAGLHEFVLPALRIMSGRDQATARPFLRLPLTQDLISTGKRFRHILGRLVIDEKGTGILPVESRSSADLVSAGLADGTIAFPAAETKKNAGDLVEFRPWRPIP